MDLRIRLDENFDIRVGPHTFHVKFVDNKTAGLDDSYGAYSARAFTIMIAKDIPDSFKLSTLLHELLHVMEEVYDIKISHKDLNLVADLVAQILLDNFEERPEGLKNGRKKGKQGKNVNNN